MVSRGGRYIPYQAARIDDGTAAAAGSRWNCNLPSLPITYLCFIIITSVYLIER